VIDARSSRYRIESSNATWNGGVADRLNDWAKHAGGREARKRWRYLYPAAAGVGLAGLAIAGLTTGTLPETAGAISITIATVLIGILAAHLNARAWGRRRRTRLSPFGKLPPVGWWTAMTRTEHIMTVSAVISGLVWLTALVSLMTNLR
jgi:hypothetical protein